MLSLENIPELIAHELEHVIEQLDGIDLALRAAQSSGEVRTTVRDTFETTRASCGTNRGRRSEGRWLRRPDRCG